MMLFKSINTSEIIAICSLFVAVISIFISIKTTRMQQKHNVLSMLPVCEIFTSNYNDYLDVEIQNKGNGLLKINSVVFTNKQGLRKKQLIDFVTMNFDFSNDCELSYITVYKDKILMPSEKINLVEMRKVTSDDKIKFCSILQDVDVYIEYSDVYSNNYTFNHKIKFV